MKKFCLTTFGAAVGTLIYTRFLDDGHIFDWYRAAFVGIVAGLFVCVVAWVQKKNKQVHDS